MNKLVWTSYAAQCQQLERCLWQHRRDRDGSAAVIAWSRDVDSPNAEIVFEVNDDLDQFVRGLLAIVR